MEIFSVRDEKFRKYGKVWDNIESTKLLKGMEHTPLPEDVIYVVGYDVSYASGARNAKCAAAVIKCTKQTVWMKKDKYLKQAVWINDWEPKDPMVQAKKLKQVWARYYYDGSQAYIAIDAWQYGTAVLQALMTDLGDGLPPLCCYEHSMFADCELDGALPVIHPIRAGGVGTTDPDSDMVRYMETQFAYHNIELLTFSPPSTIRLRTTTR